jgi:hypothetical protein
MGSGTFRSAEVRRRDDIGIFTEGLAEGEQIIFWKRLPHSAVTRMTSEATSVKMDRRGRVEDFKFDVGRSARIRVIEGIVDWTLFDENGKPVIWDRQNADALLDGLRPELLNELSKLVGADDENLSDAADPAEANGETKGEDFAASSLLP